MFGSVYLNRNETPLQNISHFIGNTTLNGALAVGLTCAKIGIHVHPISAAIYGGLVAVVDQIFEREMDVSERNPLERLAFFITSRTICLITSVKFGMTATAALYLCVAAAIIPLALSVLFSVAFLVVRKLVAPSQIDEQAIKALPAFDSHCAFHGVLNSFRKDEFLNVSHSREDFAGQCNTHTFKDYEYSIHIDHCFLPSIIQVPVVLAEREEITEDDEDIVTKKIIKETAEIPMWHLWESISWERKVVWAESPGGEGPLKREGCSLNSGQSVAHAVSEVITAIPRLFVRRSFEGNPT